MEIPVSVSFDTKIQVSRSVEILVLTHLYGQVLFTPESREHFDCSVKADRYYIKRDTPIINNEDIKTQIKKMKTEKASGPYELKPKLYKYLMNNENILNTIKILLYDILDWEEVAQNWKTSIKNSY